MDTVKASILDLYDHTITSHRRINRLIGACKYSFKKQKKINRSIAFCAISVAANIVVLHCICDEHDKKIKKLNKEIEELKKPKGE